MRGQVLNGDKLKAIVCVAGGWAGGNAASEGLLGSGVGCVIQHNTAQMNIPPFFFTFLSFFFLLPFTRPQFYQLRADLAATTELMFKQSVWTSVVSAQLAAHHLAPGGTLVLTGALAAREGTPGMIGYGMAKVILFVLSWLVLHAVLLMFQGACGAAECGAPPGGEPGTARCRHARGQHGARRPARHARYAHEPQVYARCGPLVVDASRNPRLVNLRQFMFFLLIIFF